jgi:sugar O-acyltransferase (sialic acid O-acetyltransferase NeuD family)
VSTGLVIVGAGGFARETAAAVRDSPEWRLLGFVDDEPTSHGRSRSGVPVLGPVDLARSLDARVVVCVGSPRDYTVRSRLVRRLGLPQSRYATVVHPSAQVGAGCVIAPGSVLLAQVTLTADVRLGAHVAVMPQVVLTHDDVVDDFATIASGVRLGGDVHIGRGAYLGAGSLLREGLTVGDWSMIGMGSVVLGHVPPGQVWVGQPARYLRPAASTDVLQETDQR